MRYFMFHSYRKLIILYILQLFNRIIYLSSYQTSRQSFGTKIVYLIAAGCVYFPLIPSNNQKSYH